MQTKPANILSYDHVGIRVTDRDIARDFYQKLGFVETEIGRASCRERVYSSV